MNGGAWGGGNREWRDGTAMNDGTRDFNSMAGGANRAWQDGMRALQDLRSQAQNNPEMTKELEAMLREMQRLDPSKFPGNPQLLEKIRTQFLPALEQLELKLRRNIEEATAGNVRSGSGERIPPGYAEQVAEYYRRLSKGNK